MVATKLTLTVQPDIVRMAKFYASKSGTSVSAACIILDILLQRDSFYDE